jgi:hypothetical protein
VQLQLLPHSQLDQGTRHRITRPAEIALRKRIVTRHLHANVKAGAEPHRPGAGEFLFEPGKQLAERALATRQQSVHVP